MGAMLASCEVGQLTVCRADLRLNTHCLCSSTYQYQMPKRLKLRSNIKYLTSSGLSNRPEHLDMNDPQDRFNNWDHTFYPLRKCVSRVKSASTTRSCAAFGFQHKNIRFFFNNLHVYFLHLRKDLTLPPLVSWYHMHFQCQTSSPSRHYIPPISLPLNSSTPPTPASPPDPASPAQYSQCAHYASDWHPSDNCPPTGVHPQSPGTDLSAASCTY